MLPLAFWNFLCQMLPLLCYKTSVTYEGLGTFRGKDFYHPTNRPVIELPQSPEYIDPEFLLYTPHNKQVPDYIQWNNSALYEYTSFDPKLPTKIIVHGYMDITQNWMKKMKDYYFKVTDANIILVNWSKGAGIDYIKTVVNARVIGKMVSVLIQKLKQKFDISMDHIHLIGHSIGAHVVGYAGKDLNGTIGRITGLDPAGPLFKGIIPEGRLFHSDAKLVDVIHSNGGSLILEFSFGISETSGHIDIYPNGGSIKQPGCTTERFDTILIRGDQFWQRITQEIIRLSACNHFRSIHFFIDSILPTMSTPVAYNCHDWQSFDQGECFINKECSVNSTNCVMLGDRIEQSFRKEDLIKYIGRRFFMATRLHKQFFKFQYLICVKMGEKTIADFILERQITLRIWQSDGQSEKLDMFHKPVVSAASTSTLRGENNECSVFSLETNPELLEKIELKWARPFVTNVINVHHINMTALSYKKGLKSPKHFLFKPTISLIPKDHWVTFISREKQLPSSTTNISVIENS